MFLIDFHLVSNCSRAYRSSVQTHTHPSIYVPWLIVAVIPELKPFFSIKFVFYGSSLQKGPIGFVRMFNPICHIFQNEQPFFGLESIIIHNGCAEHGRCPVIGDDEDERKKKNSTIKWNSTTQKWRTAGNVFLIVISNNDEHTSMSSVQFGYDWKFAVIFSLFSNNSFHGWMMYHFHNLFSPHLVSFLFTIGSVRFVRIY